MPVKRETYAKKAKPRGTKYARTEALNLPGHHATACVAADVNNYSGSLQISDCDRKICLELSFSSESDWANTMYKLDMLADVLKGVQRAVRVKGKTEGYSL